MRLSESDRNHVYQAFNTVWDQTVVEVVMELLFTQPTTELVTQQDLHANSVLLRGEMGELRAELKGEMGELRAELKGEMAELRTELKGEMAELRGDVAELRGELKADIGNLYRWGAGVIVANGVAVLTALLT